MTDTARSRPSNVRWLPVVTFLVAAAALLPLALAGLRAYTPIDVVAQASPYRDQAAPTHVVNKVQNDVPEAQAVQASFWSDVRHGRFQLWSHATGAGVPTGALPFSALTAPLALPYLFTPRWYAPGLRAFLTLLTAEWGLYLLARRLRLGVGAATVAGVAFAFSGAELIMLQRVGAAAVAPWVIWACLRIVERPTARRAAAFAGLVAWSWLEGFAAATLFTLYVAGAWTAWVLVVERPRDEPGPRPFARWVGRRAAAFAGGGAVAGLLVAFQALPFAAVVRNSGLLDTRRFDGRFAMGPYTLFGQIDNAVVGGLKGPWVGTANSFEGVGLTGSICLGGAVLALVLLALGRLRVPGVASRTVPFLGAATVVMVVLCYSGGRLLDLAYALPGMRSNTIYRHRWFIPLLCALLLAVALDHLWRGDDARRAHDADPRLAPPRWVRVGAALALLGGAVVVGRAVPTFREGLRSFDRTQAVLRAFALAAVVAAAAAIVAALPAWVRARRSHASGAVTTASAAALATVVWLQLAVPMYGWIPQVSIGRYFSTTPLTSDLRSLAGRQWRFLGTGEYTPYLNSAAVDGLLDVRTTPVLDRQYRDLVQAGLPTAFAADKLKTIVQAADLDMRAPVLDELSVRYVVVGTDQTPLGDAGDAPSPTGWVAPDQAATLTPVTSAGGVAGVGVALTAATGACTGFVRITLSTEGREIGSSRRPAWDVPALAAAGQDVTVAIAGGGSVATDSPIAVAVSTEEGDGCPGLKVGTADGHVAARLFSTPVDDAWTVVATRQAWVYERPSAKPLVRVDAGQVTSSALVSNGVRATVLAARNATVTVAENDDPGWEVRVNGRRVTPVAVDGALVGVPVGPGLNAIALDYVPQGFRLGRALTGVGLVALAGLVWGPALATRRGRRRRPADQPEK